MIEKLIYTMFSIKQHITANIDPRNKQSGDLIVLVIVVVVEVVVVVVVVIAV